MKSLAPRRRAPTAAPHFDHQLRNYSTLSAAAIATGAALVGAGTAEAQTIVNLTAASFGGTLPSATFGSPVDFQINGAGFGLKIRRYSHVRSSSSSFFGAANVYGAILKPNLNHGFAKDAVIAYDPIGSIGNPGVAFATTGSGVGAGREGMFQPPSPVIPATGYMGFRVNKAGNNYYGWLRVRVTETVNGRPDSISLVADVDGVAGAYALNSILAGQTASAIPEPANVASGLALFALGAVGVRAHRKRRQAAA